MYCRVFIVLPRMYAHVLPCVHRATPHVRARAAASAAKTAKSTSASPRGSESSNESGRSLGSAAAISNAAFVGGSMANSLASLSLDAAVRAALRHPHAVRSGGEWLCVVRGRPLIHPAGTLWGVQEKEKDKDKDKDAPKSREASFTSTAGKTRASPKTQSKHTRRRGPEPREASPSGLVSDPSPEARGKGVERLRQQRRAAPRLTHGRQGCMHGAQAVTDDSIAPSHHSGPGGAKSIPTEDISVQHVPLKTGPAPGDISQVGRPPGTVGATVV
jgi:hypothetical protein